MRATLGGFRIALIALVGFWVLLFVSTHLPPHAIPVSIGGNDKIIHAFAFACLAILIAWALPTNPRRLSQNVYWALGIGIVYGALDELLQIPVGRTADWQDFYADCLGVFGGIAIYVLVRKIIRVRGWVLYS